MNKHLYYFALLALFLVSCNGKKENESVNAVSENTVEVLNKFIDCYNRHDIKGLRALYAPDAIIISPDFDNSKLKAESAISKTYEQYLTSSPSLKADLRHYITNANEIAFIYACRGTIGNINTGDPVEMKGKAIDIEVFISFKIKNGKIIEEKSIYNQLDFMKQTGIYNPGSERTTETKG